MKYRVDVKEINYGTVEVEAISEEEALSAAEVQYQLGKTAWNCGEYELSNAKRIRDKSRDAR